jgi:hypothetical protein
LKYEAEADAFALNHFLRSVPQERHARIVQSVIDWRLISSLHTNNPAYGSVGFPLANPDLSSFNSHATGFVLSLKNGVVEVAPSPINRPDTDYRHLQRAVSQLATYIHVTTSLLHNETDPIEESEYMMDQSQVIEVAHANRGSDLIQSNPALAYQVTQLLIDQNGLRINPNLDALARLYVTSAERTVPNLTHKKENDPEFVLTRETLRNAQVYTNRIFMALTPSLTSPFISLPRDAIIPPAPVLPTPTVRP